MNFCMYTTLGQGQEMTLSFGLNSIYLIINIHIDIHTMLCETGSGSKHKAYIEAISLTFNTHIPSYIQLDDCSY